MKILQVMPRLSVNKGGGGVVIGRSLVKNLTERGHSVGVVTSDYDINLNILSEFNQWGDKKAWLFPFKTILNIASLHITKIQPKHLDSIFGDNVDVVHMQGCRTFQNIIARFYAKKYRIPYIVDAHGFPVEGSFLRRLFIKLFDTYFANDIVKDAAYCVAETQTGVEEYKRAGVPEDRIIIIPCGYDLSIFDDLPPKGNFRKKYDVYDLKNKKIILYLGGLDYIKGLDFLVQAFAELKRDDVYLVMVGVDFGFGKELRRLALKLGVKDRVIFTGGLYGRSKLEALVDADVAVFPSRAEQGLPFAGLEAIMCGTPIIVSGITGASEDVDRMNGGFIFNTGNISDLVHHINFVLNDKQRPMLSKILTKNGQNYIHKNLSIVDTVKHYEDLYKRCIE